MAKTFIPIHTELHHRFPCRTVVATQSLLIYMRLSNGYRIKCVRLFSKKHLLDRLEYWRTSQHSFNLASLPKGSASEVPRASSRLKHYLPHGIAYRLPIGQQKTCSKLVFWILFETRRRHVDYYRLSRQVCS